MKITSTEIDGVAILEPKVFPDERGYFSVTFTAKEFAEQVCDTVFVQDNQSVSKYGVIRGLHYQLPPFAQAKLVRVIVGKVIDVAVDIRKGSPTFGKHVAVELSEDNHRQLFIPRGFAHGFSVLSETAVLQYKCDAYYAPSHEGSIAFDDPALGIDWGVPAEKVIASGKDRQAPRFNTAPLFEYDTKNIG